jgi:23S rRNA pseudouridine2605 synthase
LAGTTVVDPSAPFAGGVLTFDGRPLRASHDEKTYLIMNKPAGVLTANTDTRGRTTILDVVPVEMRVPGLHAVGRLDLETTGLLLLTNDGDLTYRLSHPSHEVEKEYWLTSRPVLSAAALNRMRDGIEIEGAVRRPASVRQLDRDSDYETAITLREGRKRQVRRMVEAVGARVVRLTRVREGRLTLGGLAEGEVRRLRPDELRLLGVKAEGTEPDVTRKVSDPSGSRSRRSGRRR